jgi:nucleotide-binding universal stress UspA family protein
MLPVKTLLHPTDFSKQSAQAFRLACAVAHDYGASVVVCHVLAPPLHGYREMVPLLLDPAQLEDEVRQSLQALRPLHPTVAIEPRVCRGDAATEIVALARDVKADLIVMGTHGRTGLSRLALGSVAEAVLRRAQCPVLTVKSSIPAATVPKPAVEEPAHA